MTNVMFFFFLFVISGYDHYQRNGDVIRDAIDMLRASYCLANTHVHTPTYLGLLVILVFICGGGLRT